MKGPYVLETLQFSKPTLRAVPVTYLITMTTSTRREQYMKQLRKHRPTKHVVIVHNAGMKGKQGVRTPAQDLWHANQYIARISTAPLVLILEDDVQFMPHFARLAPEIDAFLTERRRSALAYNLGCFVHAGVPIGMHIRVMCGGCAHAVVYTRPALLRFARMPLPRWGLHDVMVFLRITTYAARKACAVQPYERTANSSYWDYFRVVELLNSACESDAARLFGVYDRMNGMGGLMVVLGCTVAICHRIVRCANIVQYEHT